MMKSKSKGNFRKWLTEREISAYPLLLLNSYDGEKVVYLFYLKQYEALKFGKSEQLRDRAMSHCNAFGDVTLLHVIVTDHAVKIEQEIKDHCKLKGWQRKDISINGHLQHEIIDLNKTSIQSVIDLMNTVAQKFTEIMEEKENENEKTVQLEAQARIAESEAKARIAESEAKARIAESEAKARIAECDVQREVVSFKKLKLELQMK